MAVQRIFRPLAFSLLVPLMMVIFQLPASASSATLQSCRGTVLRLGSTGACVQVLQQRLARLGYFRRATTTYYGGVTQEAERGFETMTHLDRDHNGELDISGVADSLVWSRLASSTAPRAPLHSGIKPGRVVYPINAWHVETFAWYNRIQIVGRGNRIIRVIPIAGNPYVASTLPHSCLITSRILHNIDVTHLWRLDYYTRMCAGRGVGTHAIPINVLTGAPSMSPSGLGIRIGRGIAPMSHGCNRMLASDARYIYDNAIGHRVYTIL